MQDTTQKNMYGPALRSLQKKTKSITHNHALAPIEDADPKGNKKTRTDLQSALARHRNVSPRDQSDLQATVARPSSPSHPRQAASALGR